MRRFIRKFNDVLEKGQRFLKKEEMQHPVQSDARLLGREFYNANDFEVTFTRMRAWDKYTRASGKPLGAAIFAVKPGEWYFMPTSFYEASWPSGRLPQEVICHWNVGTAMFKGTKPNRETVRKAKRATR